MVIKIHSFYKYPLQCQCIKYLRHNHAWSHPRTQVLRSRCISRGQIYLWWWLQNLCPQQCCVPAPRLVFKHHLLPSGLTNKPKWAQGHSLRKKERAVHGWPASDGHLFLTLRGGAAAQNGCGWGEALPSTSVQCLSPLPMMFFSTDLLLTNPMLWEARQLLGQAGIEYCRGNSPLEGVFAGDVWHELPLVACI